MLEVYKESALVFNLDKGRQEICTHLMFHHPAMQLQPLAIPVKLNYPPGIQKTDANLLRLRWALESATDLKVPSCFADYEHFRVSFSSS